MTYTVIVINEEQDEMRHDVDKGRIKEHKLQKNKRRILEKD